MLILLAAEIVVLGELGDDAAESQDSQQVGDDHQAVEHVRHIPDQGNLLEGTHHDEYQSDNTVDGGGLLAAAKQCLHIALTEEVPADDGGESEEQQADCHESIAEGAEGIVEGSLCQTHSGQQLAVSIGGAQHTGGQDHQCGHGQHDEGIDEDTDHSHSTLILGLVNLSHGVGVGSGAHTGFVGEQTAGNTEADGFLDADTDGTAHDSLGGESAHKDGLQSRQDVAGVHADGNERTADVEDGHNGNQLLGDGSNALHASQENEGGNGGNHDTGGQLGNTEGGEESVTDGVGLNHVAHEAQGQDDGNGEEGGHGLAQSALESSADVIDGAAGDGTVFADFLIVLCQNSFAVDGSHAEECGQPHPEHSAGTAGNQCGGTARDVAGTDLSGNGGGQSLERTHAVLAGSVALQADVAEDQAHTFTELPDLDEIGTDGKEDAAAQQQEQQ